MKALEIELPDELYGAMPESEIRAVATEAVLARLYDMGVIGSGRGAQILGVSRREFMDVLGRYGVSTFDEHTNPAAEAAHG